MRLNRYVITDHDSMIGVAEEDHHPQGTSYTILINSQAISAYSAYEHRQSLGSGNHKTLRANLRGYQQVGLQGYTGVFVLAGNTSEDCTGISLVPYGGTYPTSYMGAYSRIHGDSYLTYSLFGIGVHLRNVYIDDDEAVFEFYNSSSSDRTFSCYGTFLIK